MTNHEFRDSGKTSARRSATRRNRIEKLAIALLALVLSAVSGGIEAARLPEWARTIADGAPSLPEAILEHDSRILLQEAALIVDPDGTLHMRRRTATQALSPESSEIGVGFFPFDEDTQKLRSRGWHLSPGGKTKKSRRFDEMDLTLGDVFLTDAQARVVTVPDIEAGSLVFFEFNAEEMPKQLAYQELFFNHVPADLVRVQVEVPAGWQVRHEWLRREGPPPSVVGTRYTWQMESLQVPPLRDELSDSSADVSPLLQISVVPPAGQLLEAATFDRWSEVGEWYRELSAGRDEPTDAIVAAAGQAIPDGEPAFFDEVVAVATYVRDKVRYVDKEIGIGGYQPRPAADVLTNLYGDCKDKGTLLRSMLGAVERDAYPMLVNVSRPETVSDEVPSLLAFNHFVLGVPVPDDVEVPPHLAAAIVQAGELGRLLVIDTTDEFAAIGTIPALLGGKRALVIGSEAATLVRLPDDDPAAHGVSRKFDATMADDGSVRMTMTEEYWGEPAAQLRMAYTDSRREFEQDSVVALEARWSGSKLDRIAITPETEQGRFVRTATLDLPAPGQDDTVELFRIFPAALSLLPRTSISGRTEPVVYRYARTLRFESRIEGVPALTTEPREHRDEGDRWTVRSAHELKDRVLESEWELQLGRRRFAPDEFTHLKDLWSAARKSSRPSVRRGEK